MSNLSVNLSKLSGTDLSVLKFSESEPASASNELIDYFSVSIDPSYSSILKVLDKLSSPPNFPEGKFNSFLQS